MSIYAAGPRIVLDGTYNLRESAGYAAASGLVRPGSLFRSDSLHGIGGHGAQRLAAEHGVVRIIDLRDGAEIHRAPSAVPAGLVETVHHPIFEGAAIIGDGRPLALPDIYRIIAVDRGAMLVEAVRLIADAPAGGVLVNCTAGKDRTGMVIATTLTAVGVSREQVVADYAASAVNLAGEWVEQILAYYRDRDGEISQAVIDMVSTSPAECMADALDLIDDTYGSVERLLLAHGFDDDALSRLQERLVG